MMNLQRENVECRSHSHNRATKRLGIRYTHKPKLQSSNEIHLDKANPLHLRPFIYGVPRCTTPGTALDIFNHRTLLDHLLASLTSLLGLVKNRTKSKKNQQNQLNKKKQGSYLTKKTSSSLLCGISQTASFPATFQNLRTNDFFTA